MNTSTRNFLKELLLLVIKWIPITIGIILTTLASKYSKGESDTWLLFLTVFVGVPLAFWLGYQSREGGLVYKWVEDFLEEEDPN